MCCFPVYKYIPMCNRFVCRICSKHKNIVPISAVVVHANINTVGFAKYVWADSVALAVKSRYLPTHLKK